MENLPGHFINRITKVHGQSGAAWLEDFPGLRDNLRKYWSLTGPQAIPELSFNYLEFAKTSSGRAVVLKMGVPNPELETEISALKIFAGHGAVNLLDADREKGALLLEHILPGHNLLSVCNDENATRIACQVMKYLWKPAPEEDLFPSMEMWCQGFQRYRKQYPGSNGPLPEEHVQRAGLRAEQLLKDNQEQFLLHGDLHHMNILQGESGSWLAIDPKGVIGEGAFEVGPLLYNPVPALLGIPGVDNIIQKRLDIVSENTGLNRTRIKDWCYVRAILSAIWDIEDGGNNWDFWIKIADLIAKIR